MYISLCLTKLCESPGCFSKGVFFCKRQRKLVRGISVSFVYNTVGSQTHTKSSVVMKSHHFSNTSFSTWRRERWSSFMTFPYLARRILVCIQIVAFTADFKVPLHKFKVSSAIPTYVFQSSRYLEVTQNFRSHNFCLWSWSYCCFRGLKTSHLSCKLCNSLGCLASASSWMFLTIFSPSNCYINRLCFIYKLFFG